MQALQRPLALRTVLRIDAATCAGMGVVLALASGPIGALTHIPPALLFFVGLGLLPIAVFMVLIAARPASGDAGTWLVIVGNVGWVAASLFLLVSAWIAPNGLGTAFVLAQALVVALLTWLEYSALYGKRPVLQAR